MWNWKTRHGWKDEHEGLQNENSGPISGHLSDLWGVGVGGEDRKPYTGPRGGCYTRSPAPAAECGKCRSPVPAVWQVSFSFWPCSVTSVVLLLSLQCDKCRSPVPAVWQVSFSFCPCSVTSVVLLLSLQCDKCRSPSVPAVWQVSFSCAFRPPNRTRKQVEPVQLNPSESVDSQEITVQISTLRCG